MTGDSKRVTDRKPKTIAANKGAVQIDYVDRDGYDKRTFLTAETAEKRARLMRLAAKRARLNNDVYRRYAEKLEIAAERAKHFEVSYEPKKSFTVGIEFDENGRIIR